jgi:hypothetical protein
VKPARSRFGTLRDGLSVATSIHEADNNRVDIGPGGLWLLERRKCKQ